MKNSYVRDYIMDYDALKPADIKRLSDRQWKKRHKTLLERCKEADEPGEHVAFKTIAFREDTLHKARIGICLYCGQWFQGAPFDGYEISFENARQQLMPTNKK